MAVYYSIRPQLAEIPAPKNEDSQSSLPHIIIMTPEEAANGTFLQTNMYAKLEHSQEVRFCKAEAHKDFLYGTFVIPPKSNNREKIAFRYLIAKDRIIFIEDGGFVKHMIDKMQQAILRENPGIGFFFSDFLDMLISEDLLYLTEIENQIAHLEDEVLAGTLENFNHKIMACRRKILVCSHYYLQLSDISNILQQNDHGFFTRNELASFRLFSERVGRLHEEALMLREYSTQLREVYQAQIDIRQNKIMKILTVVTTISASHTDCGLVRHEFQIYAGAELEIWLSCGNPAERGHRLFLCADMPEKTFSITVPHLPAHLLFNPIKKSPSNHGCPP